MIKFKICIKILFQMIYQIPHKPTNLSITQITKIINKTLINNFRKIKILKKMQIQKQLKQKNLLIHNRKSVKLTKLL